MLAHVKHQVDAKVTRAVHTTALGALALATMCVGIGFLTLASWLVLVTLMPAMHAALVLGSAYLGISLVTLAVLAYRGKSTPVEAPAPQPTTQTAVADVITAFAGGVNAGRQARL